MATIAPATPTEELLAEALTESEMKESLSEDLGDFLISAIHEDPGNSLGLADVVSPGNPYLLLLVLRVLHEELLLAKSHPIYFKILTRAIQLGALEIVRFLHRQVGFSPADFSQDLGSALVLVSASGSDRHFQILRYLHQNVGLTLADFSAAGHHPNTVLATACRRGNLVAVAYFFEDIGFTTADFLVVRDYAPLFVLGCSSVKIVQYLVDAVKLTDEHFRSFAYEVFVQASVSRDAVEYLHLRLNFSADEFRLRGCEIIQHACDKYEYDVVRYLHDRVGLTAADLRLRVGALVQACSVGDLKFVSYLHRVVGFTGRDFLTENAAAVRAAFQHHPRVTTYLVQNKLVQANDVRTFRLLEHASQAVLPLMKTLLHGAPQKSASAQPLTQSKASKNA